MDTFACTSTFATRSPLANLAFDQLLTHQYCHRSFDEDFFTAKPYGALEPED